MRGRFAGLKKIRKFTEEEILNHCFFFQPVSNLRTDYFLACYWWSLFDMQMFPAGNNWCCKVRFRRPTKTLKAAFSSLPGLVIESKRVYAHHRRRNYSLRDGPGSLVCCAARLVFRISCPLANYIETLVQFYRAFCFEYFQEKTNRYVGCSILQHAWKYCWYRRIRFKLIWA